MNEAPHSTKQLTTLIVVACIMSIFWSVVFPLFISIGIIIYVYFALQKNREFYRNEIVESKEETRQLQNKLDEIDLEARQTEIECLDSKICNLKEEYSTKKAEYDNTIKEKQDILTTIQQDIEQNNIWKNEKVEREAKKVLRLRELYKSIKYSIENFCTLPLGDITDEFEELETLYPAVTLKLHTMDVKELRKAYRENDKQINRILEQYSARYTTKANRAIYSLMVIALRSELQNILTKLRYDKLEACIKDIQTISQRYLVIAGEGNQNIATTLNKFIGQIEYLFINAAKIEYNYYVKKEKERQEQLAIKEKMREEAAERKALEAEKKKIEVEESKYKNEIDKIKLQLEQASTDEIENLNQRILELQNQLSDVLIKKTDIVNLQNGKAGTVYVISNLGSFGENVFKIGMTRRLDPQDRVNELGSASVPFKFDVHSFIFSEDAVSLESKIHERLNSKRVNKVNLRKEFFNVSIDELEELVEEIEPTAEFNKTMIASEYRASINTDECFTEEESEFSFDDDMIFTPEA